MSSLRDQLLGLGFKSAPRPESKADRKPARKSSAQRGGKPDAGKACAAATKSRPGKPKGGEMDLAKAYAIRAQKEKDERIAAERERQEQARLRREAQAKLDAWLEGIQPLNVADAEIARHFEYGGKIKRIYVTAEQLTALNAGELGVLQRKGRYMLVTAAQLLEAEALFADAVALKVDPDVPAADDPYADPQYQVPDDLVW